MNWIKIKISIVVMIKKSFKKNHKDLIRRNKILLIKDNKINNKMWNFNL